MVVFRSRKAVWCEVCLLSFDKNFRQPLGKEQFPACLKVLHEHCINNISHAVNGFKKCGFRPFNREAVNDKIVGDKEYTRKRKQRKQTPQEEMSEAKHKKELINAIRIYVEQAFAVKEKQPAATRRKVQAEIGETATASARGCGRGRGRGRGGRAGAYCGPTQAPPTVAEGTMDQFIVGRPVGDHPAEPGATEGEVGQQV